jgi:hypothetical protein
MRLATEVRWGVGALLALQLVTAAAAVGLLSRVAPATERVLRENDVSLQAAERALALLADPGPDARSGYRSALGVARGNITEEAERPVIQRLEELEAAAFLPTGRSEAVAAWGQLTEINRAAMRASNADAQAIGYSGAWGAVLLGGLGFALGLFLTFRLIRRIAVPITELDDTVSAARRGDPHRRCAALDGPDEVKRLAVHVNGLLDDRSPAVSRREEQQEARLLSRLIEHVPGPALVLGPDLRVEAANLAALEPSVPSVEAVVRSLRLDSEVGSEWEVIPLEGRYLVRYHKVASPA